MGDTVSETSSNWTRDEFEYVNEVRMGKNEGNDSLDSSKGEDEVSAAVSLVVGSLRQGLICLCANVARVLREKAKLEQQVADLKKASALLENLSGTTSVSGSCSVHCQSHNSNSLHESLVTQRCGSAPASFIASGLKFLKSDYQSNVIHTQGDGSRHCNGNNDCHVAHEARSSLTPKLINNNNKGCFSRNSVQASTRSLPASSFVRRKYSTISLRRVRRSPTSRQKTSSVCSTSSINSCTSCANSDDHRRSSNNSSCVITVAEIHTPPGQHVSGNKEGDALKLLARTLTNVLQSDVNEQERAYDEPEVDEVTCPPTLDSDDYKELCLPHPLVGCRCDICTHLTLNPNCQLYALTTEDGSLLPPGSTVLVEGERVGTVLYLGHEKLLSKNQSAPCSISIEGLIAQEGPIRRIGVTLKLWPPDHGEIFVPLSAVICQLDENLDYRRKESWSSGDYEYVDEDSDGELHSKPEIRLRNEEGISSKFCVESSEPLDISPKVENMDIRSEEHHSDHYFSRSPSVSSYCSVISHSLGDLSSYGLECEDVESDRDETFCSEFETSSGHTCLMDDRGTKCVSEKIRDTHEIISHEGSVLSTTYVKKPENENSNEVQGFCGSLYDTCDSAISLSFTRRLQYSECNSGPSSVTDTGRESPNFGDTWDSGCSVGRRCLSTSSGQCSDSEPDHQLGSLGDALNLVLEKYIPRKWDFEKELSNESVCGTSEDDSMGRNLKRDKESVQEMEDFAKGVSLAYLHCHLENTPGHSDV